MSGGNKVETIVKEIKNLSVSDMLELFGELKNVFGITDDMLTVSGGSSNTSDAGDAQGEVAVDPNRKVMLVMKSLGDTNKIGLIKALKEAFGMSISEAGDIFTKIGAGELVSLKSDITKKEAEEFKAKLLASIPSAELDIK